MPWDPRIRSKPESIKAMHPLAASSGVDVHYTFWKKTSFSLNFNTPTSGPSWVLRLAALVQVHAPMRMSPRMITLGHGEVSNSNFKFHVIQTRFESLSDGIWI